MGNVWAVPVSHAKVVLCMLYANVKATTCLLNTHCITKVTSTKLCSCTNCTGVFWCHCAVDEKWVFCQIVLSEQTNEKILVYLM